MTVKYSERKAGGLVHYVARAPSESELKSWVSGILLMYPDFVYSTRFSDVRRDGSQDGEPVWLVAGDRRLSA